MNFFDFLNCNKGFQYNVLELFHFKLRSNRSFVYPEEKTQSLRKKKIEREINVNTSSWRLKYDVN